MHSVLLMATKRRANVTDLELMRGVVHKIWDQGEVMESDLYHLVGNKGRIPPILDSMSEQGFLMMRMRESGQRVPLYSYTDKGRLYCMCWFLAEDLRHIGGETDLDDGGFTEIYGILGRRYGSGRPLSTSDIYRDGICLSTEFRGILGCICRGRSCSSRTHGGFGRTCVIAVPF